jgi:hypothetical protein
VGVEIMWENKIEVINTEDGGVRAYYSSKAICETAEGFIEELFQYCGTRYEVKDVLTGWWEEGDPSRKTVENIGEDFPKPSVEVWFIIFEGLGVDT